VSRVISLKLADIPEDDPMLKQGLSA